MSYPIMKFLQCKVSPKLPSRYRRESFVFFLHFVCMILPLKIRLKYGLQLNEELGNLK